MGLAVFGSFKREVGWCKTLGIFTACYPGALCD